MSFASEKRHVATDGFYRTLRLGPYGAPAKSKQSRAGVQDSASAQTGVLTHQACGDHGVCNLGGDDDHPTQIITNCGKYAEIEAIFRS